MTQSTAMQVPLLDMKAALQELQPQIKEAIAALIDSGQYILGPQVAELEARIAVEVGVKFAIGVSSGTDALLVSLMALGVQSGDLVITTPYSFFATAGAIHRAQATPVFLDIDPRTYNLDPNCLESWFKDHPAEIHRVKALIPVHLFGQCADMQAILDIAGQHNVAVIEDAAQALGAHCPLNGQVRSAGSLGTLGCFSFFPSKNLGGVGDGGMVVSNDSMLAERVRCLRNHGAHPKYYHDMVGGNFRLDTIQAAVLLAKLPYLDQWHRQRQQNAAHYDAGLARAGLCPPFLAYGRECHTYNQYVIALPHGREQCREYLREHHVSTAVYYPLPLHLQWCFRDLGYRKGHLPHSEYAAAHTLALPIYPQLTREMQDYVIDLIGQFYG